MGIAGLGDTVADAMRDLADWFAKHDHELRVNSVVIEVAGVLVEFKGNLRAKPVRRRTSDEGALADLFRAGLH
jgi:hypothetical protein